MEQRNMEESNINIKYPRAVFFTISFEFCQRFCLYSMRTVLSIYLVQWLGFGEDLATVVYHLFNMVQFTAPILGGIIADNWLGCFKTILVGTLTYGVGILTIFSGSIPNVAIPAILTFIGLFLFALGNGILTPCLPVFAGGQFVLPEQQKQQKMYFSIDYAVASCASVIATLISPIVRTTDCLGTDTCYPLSYGIASIFLLLALGIFLAGKTFYTFKAPEGNVVVEVSKCTSRAMKMKVKNRKDKKEHWLDYAADKFSETLISDIKIGLNVLKMFLTVPVFWALYDQKGSRWTFQASRMDCDFGSWSVQPDQMQLMNPLLVIALVPIFEAVIFPLFKRLRIFDTPLKQMFLGGILAGVAFLLSAGIELAVKPTDAVIPFKGEAQLRLFNTLNCPITISSEMSGEFNIGPLEAWQNLHLSAQGDRQFSLNVKPAEECVLGINGSDFIVSISERQAQSYAFHDGSKGSPELRVSDRFFESPEKSPIATSRVRILVNTNTTFGDVVVDLRGKQVHSIILSGDIPVTSIMDISPGRYQVEIDGKPIGFATFGAGGVYTLVLNQETSKLSVSIITPESTVNVFWLIPQYFFISAGEILFSITGLTFAFSQAPKSMKTLIVAGWLIAVAVGNIIVIFIAGAQFFEEAIWEYLLFAGLMFLSMIIFALQAMRYKYVDMTPEDEKIVNTEDNNEVDGSSAEKKEVD